MSPFCAKKEHNSITNTNSTTMFMITKLFSEEKKDSKYVSCNNKTLKDVKSNKPYVGFQQGRKDSGRLHGKISFFTKWSPNPKIYTKYQMDAQYILYSDCTENSDCDASCKPGKCEPLSPNCPLPPILQLAPASNYLSSSFSRTVATPVQQLLTASFSYLPPLFCLKLQASVHSGVSEVQNTPLCLFQ